MQFVSPLLGAILALLVAFIAARRRSGPAWPFMVALGVAVACWCVFEVLWLRSATQAGALHANQLRYAAIALAPVLWLWVALAQTGHREWLNPRRAWIFLVVPAVTVVLALAYPPGIGNLLWRGFLVPPEVAIPRVLHGPWFWVMVAYLYVALLSGCLLLFRHYAQSRFFRLQLYVTGIIPIGLIGLNLMFVGGLWPLDPDPTPLGFAVWFALLSWAMLRHRLLDLSPIGRGIAFDSLVEGVLILDAGGRVVDANTAACALLRRDADAVLGCSLRDLLPGATLEGLIAAPREQRLSSASGSGLRVHISAAAIHGADGVMAGAVMMLRDTTAEQDAQRTLLETQRRLQDANAELERMAHTDVLTGLANRRLLLSRLEEEYARARRHGGSLALLMIDLDHFKQVNDTRGHLAGDRVLETTGTLLRALKRPADVAARYGGEEFALLLTDTDEAGAHAAAKRVHEALRSVDHSDASERRFRVSSSVGVAMLEEADTSGEALIARADQALYAAKAAGRDRVCRARGQRFETLDGG
jgi:diguanylate cyclase (GGDEF)-like protein